MKAKIKVNGYLTIYAENELESYALSKWGNDNKSTGGTDVPKIIIDTNFPEPKENLESQ